MNRFATSRNQRPRFAIKLGDTYSTLSDEIRDIEGEPIDVSDVPVYLQVERDDEHVGRGEASTDGSTASFQVGRLVEETGTHEAEWIVEFEDGEYRYPNTDNIKIQIMESTENGTI